LTINRICIVGQFLGLKHNVKHDENTVVLRTEYFILFCSTLFWNYLSYADSSVGTAGYISQSNKQEGQITFHSHSNSKVVGSAENCC